MTGRGADVGTVQLVTEALFGSLEEERLSNQAFTYNCKVRFTEILDEEAFDLLQPQGGHGFNKHALKYHEWEGAFI